MTRVLAFVANSHRNNGTDIGPDGLADENTAFEWIDIPLPANWKAADIITLEPVSQKNGAQQDLVVAPIEIKQIVPSTEKEVRYNLYPFPRGLGVSNIPNMDNVFWQGGNWEGHNLAYISFEESTNRGLIKLPIMTEGAQKIGFSVYGQRRGHIEILEIL